MTSESDERSANVGIEAPGILVACVDANVLLSALAFGGRPQQVVDQLPAADFLHVTGPNILAEVRSNAIDKLQLAPVEVDAFLNDLRDVSTIYVPTSPTRHIEHVKDNAVLDVALTGGCNVLVTGDRKHLLPLSPFQGVIIEPPSAFLRRLEDYTPWRLAFIVSH